MAGAGETTADDPDTLDHLATDLQRLRVRAGAVPYGEIARRISVRRQERGATSAAAHIARSSVYDVFRPGRTRTSPQLVAEIALALGCSEDEAEQWRRRCLDTHLGGLRGRAAVIVGATTRQHPQVALVALLMIACLGFNLYGRSAAGALGIPLYLDMIGTAVTSIVLGPWHGVAVGIATNVLGAVDEHNQGGYAFAIVNVVGALIWGYGVRSWRLGRSPLRYLTLNVIVAIACSLVAVPIIVFVFGGVTEHPVDGVTSAFSVLGAGLWSAVFSSNLIFSLLDKAISGAVALGVIALVIPHVGGRRAPDVWFAPRRLDVRPGLRTSSLVREPREPGSASPRTD